MMTPVVAFRTGSILTHFGNTPHLIPGFAQRNPHDISILHHRLSIGYADIVNGKAKPLQAWTGCESSRSLRFTDFKTIGT